MIGNKLRSFRAVFLCSILLTALALALPQPASAHSALLRSDPTAGALLPAAPSTIQLFFSESVSLDFSSVKVLDRSRHEQPVGPLGHAGSDDRSLSAALLGVLAPGTYTVIWRGLSAVDGHLTTGSFAFRVKSSGGQTGAITTGPTATPEPEGAIVPLEGTGNPDVEGTSESPDAYRWVVRGLLLACASLLLGGALFTILVIEPAADVIGTQGEVGRIVKETGIRFARLGVGAAVVLLLMLVLELFAQIAVIKGTSITSAVSNWNAAVMLTGTTRYGFAWAMKALAALLLIVIMQVILYGEKRTGSGFWEAAVGVGSLLLLGEALSSHGAAIQNNRIWGLPLPVVSDWLHLVVAATWVGGLLYMTLALFPAFRKLDIATEERRAFLAQSVPRFSRLALISVGTLVVTGTYNLVIHSTDLGAILRSAYGQALLVKHVLLAFLVVLGAANLLRLTPLLKREAGTAAEASSETPQHRAVRRLRLNVLIESVLLGLVLVCAGGMTLLPPPSGPGNTYAATSAPASLPAPTATDTSMAHHMAEPTRQVVAAEEMVAGYKMKLTARPAPEGDEFTLDLSGSAAMTDVLKVLFRVTPQDVDAGTTQYTAQAMGGSKASWQITEPILTLDGAYQITAIIERTQNPDLKAAYRLVLAADGSLASEPAEVVDARLDTMPSPPITGTTTLTITLKSGDGQPVTGAKLRVNPLMPAHGHIRPSGEATEVAGRPGIYTMPIVFDMGGSWLLTFDITLPGKPPVKTDAALDVIGPEETPTPAP